MLGQHPEVFVSPGLNILIRPSVHEFFEETRRKPQIARALLRTIAQLYAGEQTMESIAMARRWLARRNASPSEAILRELCEKVAPQHFVDRSLLYGKRLDVLHRLRAAFPEARFLHLTRHPRQQGLAMLQNIEGLGSLWDDRSVDYTSKRPELDPQFAWFETQACILEFREELPSGAYFHLRDEDVLTRPKEVLELLCAWIGISRAPALLDQMREMHVWRFATPGPYNATGDCDLELRADPPTPFEETPTMDDALPWKSKKTGLAEAVKILARQLGH